MAANARYTLNKNFPNGDSYNGEAVGDNIKDGTGEYFWAANGATYTGQWRNDLMHGHGVLVVPNSVAASPPDPTHLFLPPTSRGYTYDGAFLAGKRAGHGTCRFANGRVHEGEWADDQMHGQGTLHGAPGLDDFTTYTGSFQMGVRSGPNGRCGYVNGDVYEGSWRNGKRHGMGELRLGGGSRMATGRDVGAVPLIYKGPFADDIPTTLQTSGPASTADIQYSDGSTYTGGVDNLRREGDGKWHLANGDVYTGQFHLDWREGRGTLITHDGSTYEGTWVRDKLSGRVTFRRAASAENSAERQPADAAPGGLPCLVSYQGPCVDGELSGAGARATYDDGSIYKGGVRQGVPDGDGVWEQCHLQGLPQQHFGDTAFFSRYDGQLVRGVPEGEGAATLQYSVTPSSQAGGDGEDAKLPKNAHGLRMSYRRNGAYMGHWSRGLPDGKGLWKWENGEAYTGDVIQGIAHGRGTLKNAQEAYEGAFADGQPSGQGTFEHHLLHEHYDGGWLRGLFHGHGTYEKRDARGTAERLCYEGAWRDGLQHGAGHETFGQRCYTGSFANGCYEGQGSLMMNGETVLGDRPVHFTSYDGEFHCGLPSGKGKMVMGDGSIVTGHFADGIPNGPCQVVFAQGLEFDGVYEAGLVIGEGRLRYSNGDQYVGSVEPASARRGDGTAAHDVLPSDLLPQRHGKGTFTFAEGNRLDCVWVHNVLHGQGVYTVAATGEKIQRNYVDGVLSTSPAGESGGGGNVFTPENMFPNTQSEEVLKEKLATKKRKPFTFVRKGETRQAANAVREENVAQEPNNSGRNGPYQSGATSPRKATPRNSLRSGSVDAATSKRSVAAAPAASMATRTTAPSTTQKAVRKPASAKGAERRAQTKPERTSPRQSIRTPHETRHPTGGTPGSRQASVTGVLPSPGGSQQVFERFQQGVMQIDALSAKGTCGLTTTDSESLDAGTDSLVSRDTRPRGPLTGPLKTLMDQASAIRSSKEDEIHLLTEELQQLNEKIWQLNFALTSGAADTKGPNHLRSDVMTSRLKALMEERIGTVDKLSFLLRG